MACSSVSNGITTPTGPNISSRAIVIELLTLAKHRGPDEVAGAMFGDAADERLLAPSVEAP